MQNITDKLLAGKLRTWHFEHIGSSTTSEFWAEDEGMDTCIADAMPVNIAKAIQCTALATPLFIRLCKAQSSLIETLEWMKAYPFLQASLSPEWIKANTVRNALEQEIAEYKAALKAL